jgi:NodT family efflux transporter outer membrane factor (OMF) lipoprotein
MLLFAAFVTILFAVLEDFLNRLISAQRARLPGYLALAVFTVAFAGCSVIKRDHYDVPVVPLPEQFKNAPVSNPPATESKNIPATPETPLDPVLVEWWHAFGSAELDDLINRSLANNPDVRILTFKIAQAKARSEQAAAGKGPTVSAPMQVTEQFPYYGVGGPVTSGLDPRTGPNGEKVKQLFQASIRGDWRVDLWGELDSLAQSSNLQLWRASFERDNAQANVAANVATSYVEYLSLNDRLRVARETETVLSEMVLAVEDRMKNGDATAIDVEQQRAAVYAVRATIPALEQQREDALGTIAFLLGTVPESLTLSDSGLDSLSLPSVIPGVPATLLLRRPDVRMVEARLLAADADIDVARARILPPLDLTAQVGYGSYYLSELFKPQALFWNAIANLSVSIFDGGKLSSEKDYAKAVHEEMVETYVRTIYQAVREVDSSLNAIRQTGKRLEAQKKSADAAHRAWDFSSEVYAAGAIDFMTLLDTERTYHQNLDEYHRIRKDRYSALVSLFHALGGGVPQGEALPGKGERPSLPPGVKGGIVLASSNSVLAVEGADWIENPSYDKEDTWLVELPGVYHRKTIDAAWLDLQKRFPALMQDLSLRRYQKGRMEDSADKRLSWYQLYLAKFLTADAAEALCATLRANHQRCRAVFSKKGNIDGAGPASLQMDSSLTIQQPAQQPVTSETTLTPAVEPPKASGTDYEANATTHLINKSEITPVPEAKSPAESKLEPAKIPVAQNEVEPGSKAEPENKTRDEPLVTALPEIELPSVWEEVLSSLPQMPSLSLSELPTLSLPEFSELTWSTKELPAWPELPAVPLPELPMITLPEFPVFSLPALEWPLQSELELMTLPGDSDSIAANAMTQKAPELVTEQAAKNDQGHPEKAASTHSGPVGK